MPAFSRSTMFIAAIGFAFTLGCDGGARSKPTITARPKPVAGSNGGGAKTSTNNNVKKAGGGAGTFTGTITTDAKSSSGQPTGYVAKPFCMNPEIKKKIEDDSLVVGANGGLANAFVYLVRKPSGYTPAEATGEKEFTNDHCMFKPRVLIARVGQTVRVTNKDNVAHNTHTNPVVGSGFNQNVDPKGSTFKYDAAEPLPVKVNCDIHGWMFAYQLPLDHDLVDITDKDGKFTIKNIPPGTHRFTIWHEKGGYLERSLTIVIGPGGTVDKKLNYPAAKLSSFQGRLPNSLTLQLK